MRTPKHRSWRTFTLSALLAFAALLGLAVIAPSVYAGAIEPRVVLVTGDDEYRSEITMPMIARILAEQHGVQTQVLFAKPSPTSKQNIEGLESLDKADLAVFFLRFRALPEDQLAHILRYVESGKPIIGLRTSTHAFAYPAGHPRAGLNDSFGREVFGQKWLYHHGHTSTTNVSIAAGEKDNPILHGVEPRFHVASWLYHVIPLEGDCVPLLLGEAVHSEQKKQETEPVAWTKTHRGGKVFFTTLGNPKDFEVESVRRLLVNAVYWSLGREVPERAVVDIPPGYTTPETH